MVMFQPFRVHFQDPQLGVLAMIWDLALLSSREWRFEVWAVGCRMVSGGCVRIPRQGLIEPIVKPIDIQTVYISNEAAIWLCFFVLGCVPPKKSER